MTKQDFMHRLENALARLKPEERREILADFEEHFANGMASGKTEEEVARELGDPAVLAEQYTEGLPEPKTPVKASGVAAGALASIALLLFNAMIAIPVIASLFAVWVSLWVVVVSLFVASLFCFITPFFAWIDPINGLIIAGVFALGISMLALTVLAGIGMVYASKWAYKGLAAYLKAHIRIIKGGTRI
jgi:uncharacterized membrane protein